VSTIVTDCRRPGVRSESRGRVFAVLAVAASCLLLAGCNILGPAYAILAGPPKQDARYVLPEDRVTVVFVDDPNEVLQLRKRALLRRIGERSTDVILQEKELVARMIRPADPLALAASADRAQALLPVAEIGSRVGAEVLIYVEMLALQEFVNGEPRPTASARVQVLDIEARTVLWPTADIDSEERGLVTAALPPVDPQVLGTMDGKVRVYEALADLLGENIAKLFYKHEIRAIGENLGAERSPF